MNSRQYVYSSKQVPWITVFERDVTRELGSAVVIFGIVSLVVFNSSKVNFLIVVEELKEAGRVIEVVVSFRRLVVPEISLGLKGL